MSELIRREDLENWLRTECAGIDTYEDKEYVIGRLREDLPTVNSWHMVEEPPKEHMWCFVYTDEPDMIMPIRIAFYVASCTGKGSWYHYESGEDIDDEVDYWTPMYLEWPDVDKDLSWPIEPPKEDA